jgi:hypothetical protein
MRLAPGGRSLPRAHITDPDVGASEGKVVCVHIPLISNERCVVQSWGLDGTTSSMVMRPDAATVEMLRNAMPAPLDESTDKP